MELSEEVLMLALTNEENEEALSAREIIDSATRKSETLEFWLTGVTSFAAKEARDFAYGVVNSFIDIWFEFSEEQIEMSVDTAFNRVFESPDFSHPGTKLAIAKMQAQIAYYFPPAFEQVMEKFVSMGFSSFHSFLQHFSDIVEYNIEEDKTNDVVEFIHEKGIPMTLFQYTLDEYHKGTEGANEALAFIIKFMKLEQVLSEEVMQIITEIFNSDQPTGILILLAVAMKWEFDPTHPENEEALTAFAKVFQFAECPTDEITCKHLSKYIGFLSKKTSDLELLESLHDISIQLLETTDTTVISNVCEYLGKLIMLNPDKCPEFQQLAIEKILQSINASVDSDSMVNEYQSLLLPTFRKSPNSFKEIIGGHLSEVTSETRTNVCAALLSAIEAFTGNTSSNEMREIALEKFGFLLETELTDDPFYVIAFASLSKIVRQLLSSERGEYIEAIFNRSLEIFVKCQEMEVYCMRIIYQNIKFILQNFAEMFIDEEHLEVISHFIETKEPDLLDSFCLFVNKLDSSDRQELYQTCIGELLSNLESGEVESDEVFDFISKVNLDDCDDLKSELATQFFEVVKEEAFENKQETLKFIDAIQNTLGFHCFEVIGDNMSELENTTQLLLLAKCALRDADAFAEANMELFTAVVFELLQKAEPYFDESKMDEEMPEERDDNNDFVESCARLAVAAFPKLDGEQAAALVGFFIKLIQSSRLYDDDLFAGCIDCLEAFGTNASFDFMEELKTFFEEHLRTNIAKESVTQNYNPSFLSACRLIKALIQNAEQEGIDYAVSILTNIEAPEEAGTCFLSFLKNEMTPDEFIINIRTLE